MCAVHAGRNPNTLLRDICGVHVLAIEKFPECTFPHPWGHNCCRHAPTVSHPVWPRSDPRMKTQTRKFSRSKCHGTEGAALLAINKTHLKCPLLQEASLTTPGPMWLHHPHFSPGPEPRLLELVLVICGVNSPHCWPPAPPLGGRELLDAALQPQTLGREAKRIPLLQASSCK